MYYQIFRDQIFDNLDQPIEYLYDLLFDGNKKSTTAKAVNNNKSCDCDGWAVVCEQCHMLKAKEI